MPLALLVGAGALAFGASSFASAQDPKPPTEKPKDGPGGEPPREGGRQGRGWGRGPGGPGGPGLEGSMQAMKAASKALEKELPAKDPNAWKSISQFERGVAGAKLEEPKLIKEMPEGERAKAEREYHTRLADLLQASCKMEHEILAGKWDDATKTWNETIKPMQKPGHDKFKEDD
ncbi:MAG: hypothetical protein IPJ19_12330 [Planctomycetes bacterium]|nr:hypothetical protein [Planctomycetota bacterium]